MGRDKEEEEKTKGEAQALPIFASAFYLALETCFYAYDGQGCIFFVISV